MRTLSAGFFGIIFIGAITLLAAAGCASKAPAPSTPEPDAAKPTNSVAAVNVPTNTAPPAVGTNNAVEKDLKQLMAEDDAAAAEVDGWIRENQAFAAQGAGIPDAELNRRIRARLEVVRQDYEAFIKGHPDNAEARLAYASLLDDLGEEDAEFEQLQKALALDPTIPSVWNNLANYYGHNGPITNAFVYYQKAVDLDSNESVYYHNFGTTVYLYRKDAAEFYKISEQRVFDKALDLYSNAVRLDPTNFALATDVAETYYGIHPLRTNAALQSWTNALSLAHDEVEREGVYIHLARIKLNVGWFDEARAHLNAVTNPIYSALKNRLQRNLDAQESGTNPPAYWVGGASPDATTNGAAAAAETNSPPVSPN